MSIIDFILGQTAILAVIGAALLLLIAAVGILVVIRVRALSAQLKQARIQREVERVAEAAEATFDAEEEEELAMRRAAQKRLKNSGDATESTPQKPSRELKLAAGGAPASGGVKGSVLPAAATAPKPAEPPKPVEAAKPAEPVKAADAVSGDMQDILSSVFVDEEAQARFKVLMEGREPVSAAELVDLANSVLDKIKGGYAAAR